MLTGDAVWDGSRVIVVVPAYDEAPRIGRVVRTMPAWVDEIVVVDDASHDATPAAALAPGDPRVAVERHRRNRGVGAAIATGYRRACASAGGPRDAFAVMAGDGQMDPRDLQTIVEPISSGRADYVKGDRFRHAAGTSSMPLARRIGGGVLSRATALALGRPISDSQCGYTAIARAACETLDLDGLWPGYGYPNDLLSQVTLRGLRITEVPVRAVYADEVSRLGVRHVPVVGALVVRAWWRRVVARR